MVNSIRETNSQGGERQRVNEMSCQKTLQHDLARARPRTL